MKSRLLILLYLLSSLLTPMTGSAWPRGQIVAIDNSVYVALVDSSIEKCICIQEKDNWCWAACIQMIRLKPNSRCMDFRESVKFAS